MPRWPCLAIATTVGGRLMAGCNPIGRLLRTVGHELEVDLAGGPFQGVHVEREPLESGFLAAFFVSIRLVLSSAA